LGALALSPARRMVSHLFNTWCTMPCWSSSNFCCICGFIGSAELRNPLIALAGVEPLGFVAF
jgi:hypothetical protein